MALQRQYYVYILASSSGTLYVGVTNDLEKRIYEHKHKLVPGFTSKYDVNKLLYFEQTSNAESAITREKEIKSWRRSRKIELFELTNPGWRDLAEDWFK